MHRPARVVHEHSTCVGHRLQQISQYLIMILIVFSENENGDAKNDHSHYL